MERSAIKLTSAAVALTAALWTSAVSAADKPNDLVNFICVQSEGSDDRPPLVAVLRQIDNSYVDEKGAIQRMSYMKFFHQGMRDTKKFPFSLTIYDGTEGYEPTQRTADFLEEHGTVYAEPLFFGGDENKDGVARFVSMGDWREVNMVFKEVFLSGDMISEVIFQPQVDLEGDSAGIRTFWYGNHPFTGYLGRKNDGEIDFNAFDALEPCVVFPTALAE